MRKPARQESKLAGKGAYIDVSDRSLQVQLTLEAKIASDFSLVRAIFAFAGFVSALWGKSKWISPFCRAPHLGRWLRLRRQPAFAVPDGRTCPRGGRGSPPRPPGIRRFGRSRAGTCPCAFGVVCPSFERARMPGLAAFRLARTFRKINILPGTSNPGIVSND